MVDNQEPAYYAPYKDPGHNHIYNLLFCDNWSLWAKDKEENRTGTRAALFSPEINADALFRVARDEQEESRYRLLAYRRLQEIGLEIERRILMGVVVEVPMDGGLDTLAAFPDGRVRYINHSGRLVILETMIPAVIEAVATLTRAALAVVDRIGPWEKQRLPPPAAPVERFSFLVSDGLYFGQGKYPDIMKDPLARPVMEAATKLLLITIDVATKQRKPVHGT